MSNDQQSKIEAIGKVSAIHLVELLSEHSDDIQEAIHHAYIQAQEKTEDTGKETDVKLVLTHKISIDFSLNEQKDSIHWNVAHKGEIKSTMHDPNQPELPMDESKPSLV
jgi:hypothetical protein